MKEAHLSDSLLPGQLFVVGLGPGATDLMTPRARAALERAAVVVGYERYLELVPPCLLEGKRVVTAGMRQEMERCRLALAAAREGVDVAVVCSGDPGIYALAPLVFELAEAEHFPFSHIAIVPGVSAMCSAAALLGAPLGHDFACVSLSDALTPWSVIEKRVHHALAADFVLVLYNPRSKKRPDGLGRVLALARAMRGDACAAGVVRLGDRPGEERLVTTLGALEPEKVDMFCLVVIGASSTRCLEGRMVTPRGYLEKYGVPAAHDA